MNPCPLVLETTALPLSYSPDLTLLKMKLNFNKHILELKNRFLLLLLSWFTITIGCYCYKEIILFYVIKTFEPKKFYFIITDVSELFNIHIKLSLFAANQTVLLLIIYHVLMFIAPGCYQKETKILKKITKIIILIVIVSFNLTHFIFVPLMTDFFSKFQQNINNYSFIQMFFEAKLAEYIHFYINIYFLSLLNILGMVIVISVVQSANNNYAGMKRMRKFFYLIFLIFATLTTPPDIISQLAVTSVIILLYETTTIIKHMRKALIRQPIKTY